VKLTAQLAPQFLDCSVKCCGATVDIFAQVKQLQVATEVLCQSLNQLESRVGQLRPVEGD